MKPQLPSDYHDDAGHMVGPYPKTPDPEPINHHFWLGASGYAEEAEADGWITLWPRVA